MLSTVNVAAVQFPQRELDVRANSAVAVQLAFEAALAGARVIVLPELCTTGTKIATARDAVNCAQLRGGSQSARLSQVSRRFGCYIVHGYVELCDGALFNSAAIIDPSGRVVGNCRKHGLQGGDFTWATASESLMPIVTAPFGRIGVLIGRDALNADRKSAPWHRDDIEFYRRGSVDVICLLARTTLFGGAPDESWVDLAESTNANVIVSNQARDGMGMSCVIDRTLNVHASDATSAGCSIAFGRIEVK